MGVQIYILGARRVSLVVGDCSQDIGTLRRFWKVTELDDDRIAELSSARAALAVDCAPAAVMLAEAEDMLVDGRSSGAPAHLVLGWDADRASVTDSGWEYLPQLGFAIRMAETDHYLLHEIHEGVLRPLTRERAVQACILDSKGQMIRKGQPRIVKCILVEAFIPSYVKARCILDDGRDAEILTKIDDGTIPPSAWYIGRRPVDAVAYHTGAV